MLRPDDGLAADDPDHRQVALGGQRAAPLVDSVRRLGREPLEGDLVAIEEAAQARAVCVPLVPDDRGARRRRRRGEPLQAPRSAHAMARELADLLGDLGRHRRDGVVVVRLDAHHARPFDGPESDREDGAEHDRHLAEDVSREAVSEVAVDPVDDLVDSMRPSSTAKRARSAPCSAANSPGTRLMSAATRASRSQAVSSRHSKTLTVRTSSAVTIDEAPQRRTACDNPSRRCGAEDSRFSGRRRPSARRATVTGGGPVARGAPGRSARAVGDLRSLRTRLELILDKPLSSVADDEEIEHLALLSESVQSSLPESVHPQPSKVCERGTRESSARTAPRRRRAGRRLGRERVARVRPSGARLRRRARARPRRRRGPRLRRPGSERAAPASGTGRRARPHLLRTAALPVHRSRRTGVLRRAGRRGCRTRASVCSSSRTRGFGRPPRTPCTRPPSTVSSSTRWRATTRASRRRSRATCPWSRSTSRATRRRRSSGSTTARRASAAEHLRELGHARVGVLAFPTAIDAGRHALARPERRAARRLRGRARPGVGRGAVRTVPPQRARHAASRDARSPRRRKPADGDPRDERRARRRRPPGRSGTRLRRPGDLSVVGFDDSPAATLATPPLTTVAQPHEDKGRIAAEWLIEAIERGRPTA